MPATGRVWLDTLNLAGDGQEDLHNHGGLYRAVLGYSAEHYPFWRQSLGVELPFGAFGENFTFSTVTENTVCIGDIYQLGETRIQISQPRFPCWKLARRWERKDLALRVERSGRGGWYHRVLQTGYVEAGDTYTLLERPHSQLTIALLNDLMAERLVDPDVCATIAEVEALTPHWRDLYRRLAEAA